MTRLGCARMVLSRSQAMPQHDTISRLQADAVIDLMQRQSGAIRALCPEARARVSTLATAGAWCPADLARILKLLEPPMPKQATSRSDMQTYTPNILHYFTASEWSGMQGRGVVSAMDLLITRLLQLGAKCLSEPCKAWCASLLLSLNDMGRCTEYTKQQVHVAFKSEYMRRRRKHSKAMAFPGVRLLQLPSEFKEEYPDVYAEVFSGGDPVPSKIDFEQVELMGISCRTTHKKSIQMLSLSALENQERDRQTAPPMQLMQQLVSMQQDNLQMLRASVRPVAHPAPTCLSALTSQPPHAPQGLISGRLALPPAPPQYQPIVESITEGTQDMACGAAGGESSPDSQIGGPISSEATASGSQVVEESLVDSLQLNVVLDTQCQGQASQEEDSFSGLQLAPFVAPPRQQQDEAPAASMAIVPAADLAPAAAGPALALQIMGEMGAMAAARKRAPEAASHPKAKAKAKAAGAKGKTRQRWHPRLR